MTEVLGDFDDILDAAEKIKRFTEGMNYEAFAEDPKTVDAGLQRFEVIREGAKNVPREVR